MEQSLTRGKKIPESMLRSGNVLPAGMRPEQGAFKTKAAKYGD
jgi:hypothetical protein